MPPPALILDDFIPYRLAIASILVSDQIARTYEALFGLSVPEWRIVAVVAETGGITQQQICARTRMDKVTVSRAAIGLADRGLLERRANPDDRRSHRLLLSADGRTLYAAVVPQALELERRLFAGFAADELAGLRATLARIEAAALALDESRAA